jgi:hypothetical protein
MQETEDSGSRERLLGKESRWETAAGAAAFAPSLISQCGIPQFPARKPLASQTRKLFYPHDVEVKSGFAKPSVCDRIVFAAEVT